MAFGPSRHPHSVVGQKAVERLLGSRDRFLGGLLEADLKHLGGRLGPLAGVGAVLFRAPAGLGI